MRKPQRKDLINQIQENDKLIQSHIEVDYPKTLRELQKLSMTELRDWFDRRTVELKFLTQDTNFDEVDLTNKS